MIRRRASSMQPLLKAVPGVVPVGLQQIKRLSYQSVIASDEDDSDLEDESDENTVFDPKAARDNYVPFSVEYSIN